MDSRKLTRRSFLKFAGFSLLGLGLGLVSSPRPARSRGRGQGPLTLSYPLSLDAIPLEFAHKRGLFQAHGLKVELLLLPEDLSRREAFISGRLDGLICDLSTVV
ncbi:TPA: twin-arginine translocation signal domain-containing protein, partial [Candidatus Bipolaricaulota bacterium]|nr:twin-arginine translocation signal domain-containing protein [Candidatus Bipolaricaulota bacterium]